MLGNVSETDAMSQRIKCLPADIAGECTVETGQHVAAQMGKLLDEMRQRLPSTNIVVMAILPKVLPR